LESKIYLGGSVLFIESSFINPVEALDKSSIVIKDDKTNAATGSLTLTGKLGDVMKESCKIALTYAKSYLQQIDPNNRSLRIGHIHVHVPEVRVEIEIWYFEICCFFSNRREQHQKMVHRLVVR
jgi:ATP-dependent Lon protease